MNDPELIRTLGRLQATMISVATGGAKIKEAEADFKSDYDAVADALSARGMENPIPYRSLWDWYGHWSSGDLPSYQSRRAFVSSIFSPLVKQLQQGGVRDFVPTGWDKVDRTIGRVRKDLSQATNEEEFQVIGTLCREALISLAQAVYVAEKHPILDGKQASESDAKRLLEAYIAVELGGGANDDARKHAKSSLDLANMLQHKRTATFRDAALCVEASSSVINIIAILSGRRDPENG